MARLPKEGLEYFSLDCALNDKFRLIEAEFGLDGFGVVVKLYQKIYGQRGYYVEWTNEVALLFAKDVGLGGSVVSEIVSASIKRGIFDSTMFEKYGILTSERIQETYLEAIKHRKTVELKKQYLLVNATDILENANIFLVYVDINPENECKNPQSKVKKSKGKERRDKDICGQKPTTHTRFIPPSVDDVIVYCRERGNSVDPERFVDFYAAKGWMVGKNKMKDWKACVRTWEKNEQPNLQIATRGQDRLLRDDI